MAILLCMRQAHNVLMYSFENDKLYSLWFVTLIKVETHYCPALSNTHTHTSSSLLLSCTYTKHAHGRRHTHTLIPLHGPLGFVVAKSLNKLRNDWNWKMSNGDSSAVRSQYGDDEIWFFEVRYIIRAEWLPRLWLKRDRRPFTLTYRLFYTTISHCWHKINALFISAIAILLLLIISNHTKSIGIC